MHLAAKKAFHAHRASTIRNLMVVMADRSGECYSYWANCLNAAEEFACGLVDGSRLLIDLALPSLSYPRCHDHENPIGCRVGFIFYVYESGWRPGSTGRLQA